VNADDGMKIGELAASVGVAPSAIRFYESYGLMLPPLRASNGYRIYSGACRQRLLMILTAQRLGFSLERLRRVMQNQSTLPHDQVLASLTERLAEIERMQEELLTQHAAAKALMERLEAQWARGECLIL